MSSDPYEINLNRYKVRMSDQTVDYWRLVTQALGRIEVHSAIPEKDRPPYGLLDFTAYFILAYHVRDHLIRLEGHAQKDVDGYVATNRALAYCRDLCVNVKHRENGRPMTEEADALTLDTQSAEFPLDGGSVPWTRVIVKIDGRNRSARDLAIEVHGAWLEYGLPFIHFVDEVWSYAPTIEDPHSGVTRSFLMAPRPDAWPAPPD